MNSEASDGGKAVFYRKLFSLMLPIAFQQFMLAEVSASDALMLGLVNQDSLSAVSLAGQITFVFNLFMGGLAMEASILAAQYYGKGDVAAIEKIFAYVIRISFLISAAYFFASLFMPNQLMRIFTSEPHLIRGGSVYLRIVSASYLFTGISQVTLCILKNTGYAMKSMVVRSSAVVLNADGNGLGLCGIPAAKPSQSAYGILPGGEPAFGSGLLELYGSHAGDYLVWGYGFTMYSVIMGHRPCKWRRHPCGQRAGHGRFETGKAVRRAALKMAIIGARRPACSYWRCRP